MASSHHLLALAVGGLTIVASPALAGPCTDRIAQFEKTLASTDAGSGPTGSISKGASGASQQQGASGAHPPTARMNQATGDKAASPADVRAQTQGENTASKGGSPPIDPAMQALARARTADAQGNAAECNAALDQAMKATQAK
ncbi:hypothetical protein [Alsobacter soli]|uniref:hypothetical protein n=1 Tax=Alsobacter soli TaxID=2109933 RepID=UPI001FE085A5|nr:hypothetical protein [Alsobacter soli]